MRREGWGSWKRDRQSSSADSLGSAAWQGETAVTTIRRDRRGRSKVMAGVTKREFMATAAAAGPLAAGGIGGAPPQRLPAHVRGLYDTAQRQDQITRDPRQL